MQRLRLKHIIMTNTSDKIKIRKQVSFWFGCSMLILLSVVSVSSYLNINHILAKNIEAQMQHVQNSFTSEVSSDTDTISALIDPIVADESLQHAFLVRDRQGLLDNVRMLFEENRAKYRITHFYFHDIDRVNFLRVHNPSMYGDLINRFTALGAERTQKQYHGIELGPLGTFTLRVVRPWKVDGELIGYIELGEEIKHITPKLKQATGSDLIFVINKQYLNRDKWQEGNEMLGKNGNWDQFVDFVAIDSTITTIPETIQEYLTSSHSQHADRLVKMKLEGKNYLGKFLPLIDAGDCDVGDIVIISNITEAKANYIKLLSMIVGVFLVVGSLLTILFNRFLKQIEHRLKAANNDLQDKIEEQGRTEQNLTRAIQQTEESKKQLKEANQDLIRVAEKISITMTSIVEGGDMKKSLVFENPEMINCQQTKNCGKTDCPAYSESVPTRCWEIASTFCKEQSQGLFAKRINNCAKCEVYQQARSNPICNLGESFNTMITVLTDRQEELKKSKEISLSMMEDLNKTQAEQKKLVHDMGKRMKEIKCMYGVTDSIRSRESLREVFMDAVMLVPPGCQHPEITQARITYDENDYVLDVFEESPWKMSSDIVVNGHVRGSLEVYYKEERPECDEGPFLKEERHLIDNIAHVLSEAVERKEIEQKLHQIQVAMEDATDAIAITNEEGHITYINAAFGKLFKYTSGETETIDFNSIFVDPAIGANAYRESLNGGFWTGETEMVSSEEQVFSAYLRSSSITDKGSNHLGVLFVINDITELKEAEKHQAKLLEQVASINGELMSFAYIISHDLKAPLRGISSLADWLSDDYRDALGEDGKGQMDLLKSRVGRMQDLIDGVLQYSRVGRVKEEVVDVELGEVVPEVIDLLAAGENISITVDKDLPTISSEKTRISQLFQNILSNSIKYMDKPQGQIHVGCAEDGDNWRFSISDNGPGIEEKHFEKIFQIFQTVSEDDSYESTGVGLSVVKKIVEMYGGSIWVESEVGKGCTFFFTLPMKERISNNETVKANTVS